MSRVRASRGAGRQANDVRSCAGRRAMWPLGGARRCCGGVRGSLQERRVALRRACLQECAVEGCARCAAVMLSP